MKQKPTNAPSWPATIGIIAGIAVATVLAVMAVPYITGPINEHNLRSELNTLAINEYGDANSEHFITKTAFNSHAQLDREYVIARTDSLPFRDDLVAALREQGYAITNNTAHLVTAEHEDYKLSIVLTSAASASRVIVTLNKY